MKCKKCKAELPANAKFCPECATPVPSAGGGVMAAHGSVAVGGSVSKSNIVVGSNNSINQSRGVQAEEIAKLFAAIYQKIEARPEDPEVDKEEITQTVQRIEQETVKGDEANPGKVERLLTTLSGMAPDIGEVIVASLTSPAAGIAAVIRKVAQKAQEEAQKSQ